MPQRRRRTGAETRRRCLDAGVDLFFQLPVVHAKPFKNVTVDGVAAQVGISRQAVYDHWPCKEDYHRDLAAYLLGNEDLYKEDFDRISAVVEATGGCSLPDAISQIATADVTSLTDNRVFYAMTTLAVVYVRGDEQLEDVASQGYRDIDGSTWRDLYEVALARAGRVPREPMTGEAIGAILQALVEGSGIRHLFDPGALSDPDPMTGRKHGLYALAVMAILAVMTRPAHSADQRPVETLLGNLLEGLTT
jgi:AcrR family transcriptional regulator